MKTSIMTIIVFTILLIISLMAVSQWGEIQKEIWFMTGEYTRDSVSVPSVDYDYSMLYVLVFVIFGIIGTMLFGIFFILWRKRK